MENLEIKKTSENKKYFTEKEIEDYKRDGFIIVKQMYDDEEMKSVTKWVKELTDLPEEPGKHWVYYEDSLLDKGKKVLSRIEKFVEYHEKLGEIVLGDKIVGRVSELLGEPAVLFKEKINFKLPGGEGFKPHQDVQTDWEDYAKYFISVMVTVDENTVENGCLELASGNHKLGLIGERWKSIEGDDLKGINFVKYPTKPGDVIFFDCYVPHQSAPNLSSRPRRNMFLTYNRLSEGDHRKQFYETKHKTYPPDIERISGKKYEYRV